MIVIVCRGSALVLRWLCPYQRAQRRLDASKECCLRNEILPRESGVPQVDRDVKRRCV